MKRRTTEVTIELESHLEMKWSVTSSMSHCGQCQKVVTVVSPHEDGKLDNERLREILLRLSGVVHIIESADGTFSICLPSLLSYSDKREI